MTNSFPNATEVQQGQPSSDSRVEVKDRGGEDPPRHEDEDVPLTMTSRLLLSAELLGAEASTGFEQLYTVPNLQTLGMPLSLVSLTGLVAGATATVLLPAMGCYGDRGQNPARRRTRMVVLSCLLQVVAVCVVIAANMLHLCHIDSDTGFGNHTHPRTISFATFTDLANSTHHIGAVGSPKIFARPSLVDSDNSSAVEQPTYSYRVNASYLTDQPVWNESDQLFPQSLSHSELLSGQSARATDSGVPFAAGLGMLGYITLDIAYDCVTSNVKTWMLMCSPSSAPTPTLVAGLVMTSLGGMLSSGLGMVDLAALMGLPAQSGLAIQLSIQAAVVAVVVAVGMFSSVLTGNRLLRQRHNTPLSRDPTQRTKCDFETSFQAEDFQDKLSFQNALDMSSKQDVTSSSVLYNEKQDILSALRTTSFVESLAEEPQIKDIAGYGAIDFCHSDYGDDEDVTNSPQSNDNPRQKLLGSSKIREVQAVGCCRRGHGRSFRASVAWLCCCSYFSVGTVIFYNLTCSDYVGKAIYGGDPDAPAGSDSLVRYQQGLRIASYGFLEYYATYLLFSFVQQRVLAVIGRTAEFVVIQVLMAICLMTLALTVRIEMFFVLSAVAGVHRAVFHVVPFAVASDVSHAQQQKEGEKKSSRLGLAMSLITATFPLAYCTLFPWLGSVMELTGILAIPLYLAAAFSCMAAFLFLLIGL